MKKTLFITALLLLLAGCIPVIEGEPSLLVSEEITQPPASSSAPRSVLTAEDVLPPATKNIFLSRQDDIYCSSISAAPDGCAVVLADGNLVAFGETISGFSLERDENGYYVTDHVFDNVTYVHCSQFNTLAIDTDGILWGWGMVGYWGNILGDTGEPGPLRLMTDVQMASAGSRSYLALRKDGKVWMWGGGEYGLLGNGPDYEKYTAIDPLLEPVLVLEDVLYAELSGGRAYAIKKDYSLWAWGYMGTDPETDESIIFDRPTCIMEDVKYAYGNLAVKTDGTLWVFATDPDNMFDESGLTYYYAGEPIQIMEDVKLAKGGERFFVIKNDGSLWVWGDNTGGALGTGKDEYAPEPTKIMGDVVDVVSTMNNIYALKSNGELWEMGVPQGLFDFSSESDYIPTQDDILASCLPHRVLEGVLVAR